MSKKKNARVTFTEMPSAELVKYLVDIQHPYLQKALRTFSLCGKTITDAQTGASGTRIMADLLERLAVLIDGHLSTDEQLLFTQLLQHEHKKRNDLHALLKDIRRQHAAISRLFRKLRVLSADYTAPEPASATLRLCYAQLFNFEQDMLKHIFLEEDILFPKLLEANK